MERSFCLAPTKSLWHANDSSKPTRRVQRLSATADSRKHPFGFASVPILDCQIRVGCIYFMGLNLYLGGRDQGAKNAERQGAWRSAGDSTAGNAEDRCRR